MRPLLALFAIVVLEMGGAPTVHTQTIDVNELRALVGDATRRFVTEFSNVVAEEDYDQRFAVGSKKRHLKSDFMLVDYPGRQELLMAFRDVREVDGKPVGDRQDRITKLFLNPFNNAVRRAQDIHRDGLRLSVDNGRMMDPIGVITYLQPAYQGGFRITLGGAAPNLGPDIREIDLVPTAARGTTAKQSRAWVSEKTGDVVKTEMRSGFGARAEVTTTTFGLDPALNIRVPLEMKDEVPRGNDDFIGTAKYSNFRRFEVRTEAEVNLPPSTK